MELESQDLPADLLMLSTPHGTLMAQISDLPAWGSGGKVGKPRAQIILQGEHLFRTKAVRCRH